MSWSVIRPQLITLLNTITELQEVKASPSLQFNGFPAAYAIPSDNESDYETTTENVRTYAFIVRLFYDTKAIGVSSALSAMEALVDKVIDTFDKEDFKSSTTRTIGVNLPTGYTYLNIFAHPSTWGQLETEELIMSEIIVKIRVSIDVQNI